MNWIFFALLSALFGVGYGIVSRKLSVNSKNPRALSIVFNFTSSLLALILFSFDRWWFRPVPFDVWLYLLLAIILYAVFEGTHFYGRKYVDVSTASILFRLNTVISVAVSFIFLKELFTINKALATILILISTYLVSVKSFDLKFKKGLVYILIATLALGLVRPLDKIASTYFSLPLYTFAVYAGPVFFMSIFPKLIKFKELRNEFVMGGWKIVLLGAINILEYYFMIKAYQIADASLVIPVVSLSTVLTVLIGIVFLKERDNIIRKVIAGFLAFAGVILMKM